MAETHTITGLTMMRGILCAPEARSFRIGPLHILLTLWLLASVFPGEAQEKALAEARIVSLAPSLTEILFELGLGEQIVAVTNYCTHPPEALTKEKVGGFLNPNLEKIVALGPDLVVAEHWPSSRTVPRLQAFGLKVQEFASPKSFQEIFQMIRAVGESLNRSQQAAGLINKMQERLKVIQQRAVQFEGRRPAVYVELDLPSWTIGQDSFVTEALRLSGARNLFDDLGKSSLLASKEIIIARDPDIILAYTAKAREIRQRPGWAQISAVRTGWIIDDLDPALLSHGNHRLVDGMEQLQRRILQFLGYR